MGSCHRSGALEGCKLRGVKYGTIHQQPIQWALVGLRVGAKGRSENPILSVTSRCRCPTEDFTSRRGASTYCVSHRGSAIPENDMIYHGIFFLMPAHPVATRRIAAGQSVGGGPRLEDVNIGTTCTVQSAAAAVGRRPSTSGKGQDELVRCHLRRNTSAIYCNRRSEETLLGQKVYKTIKTILCIKSFLTNSPPLLLRLCINYFFHDYLHTNHPHSSTLRNQSHGT